MIILSFSSIEQDKSKLEKQISKLLILNETEFDQMESNTEQVLIINYNYVARNIIHMLNIIREGTCCWQIMGSHYN